MIFGKKYLTHIQFLSTDTNTKTLWYPTNLSAPKSLPPPYLCHYSKTAYLAFSPTQKRTI